MTGEDAARAGAGRAVRAGVAPGDPRALLDRAHRLACRAAGIADTGAVARPCPPTAPLDRRAIGDAFEARARAHLEAAGLVCLDANWRAHFHKQAGEIDLVMRDGATIVFVEVRARASAAFGGAAASITAAKRRRWWTAARAWLAARAGQTAEPPCRFDVVAFDAGRLDWLRDVLAG